MIFAQPKFNQFCLGVSCLVWVFGGIFGTVCAHEYEDGFVERALKITIRDGVGYGEYQIGLNSKTAAKVLELAEQLRQQAKLAKAARTPPSDLRETTPAKAQTEPSIEQSPSPARSVAETKAEVKLQESAKKQNENSVAGAGEHLTDLATIKRFGELQQHWFAGRLKLTRNGEPVELSKVSVEPAGRHPFSVVVKFQFSVATNEGAAERVEAEGEQDAKSKLDSPKSSVVDFQVTDGLFDGHHGATRYALRSRGATMLMQSNVAPVLVRADRVEIKAGSAAVNKGRKRTPVVQAKLVVGDR